MNDEPAEFDLSAALLRKAQADLPAFMEALARRLADALPDRVTIERRREGVFSTVRHVKTITVAFGDDRLILETTGPDLTARHSRIVRLVQIGSEQITLAAWLGELDRQMRRLSGSALATATGLHDFLMS